MAWVFQAKYKYPIRGFVGSIRDTAEKGMLQYVEVFFTFSRCIFSVYCLSMKQMEPAQYLSKNSTFIKHIRSTTRGEILLELDMELDCNRWVRTWRLEKKYYQNNLRD